MDFNTACFFAFGLLFGGFLVLEGFDYGVGMLLPFLGKSDQERQVILNTLAPVWEGNEVWLITAGAVLFAAFPIAYATLFSGLYLALVLILAPLVLRGVAFEFRDKSPDRRWRGFWDWALFSGSALPALLWGVTMGNLLGGLPINAGGQYAGTFGDLLGLYAISAGLLFVLLFLLHGATYLLLKADRRLGLRVEALSMRLCRLALLMALLFAAHTYLLLGPGLKPITGLLFLLLMAAMLLTGYCLDIRRRPGSFAGSSLAVAAATAAIFAELYPRIAVSSLNARWSLDIYNAAANQLTLKIMSLTLGAVLPVIIGLEAWKYYIFRHRSTLAEVENAAQASLVGRLNRDLRALIAKADCVADRLQQIANVLKGGNDGMRFKQGPGCGPPDKQQRDQKARGCEAESDQE